MNSHNMINSSSNLETLVVAGGCFWGVQRFFQLQDGVLHTQSGYAQSQIQDPTYKQVCQGEDNAVEAVLLHYAPEILNPKKILELLFVIIDPFSFHQQGADIGTQYRTGLYPETKETLKILKETLSQKEKALGKATTLELECLKNFYPAEKEHQNYLLENPSGYCHVPLDKLKAQKLSSNN